MGKACINVKHQVSSFFFLMLHLYEMFFLLAKSQTVTAHSMAHLKAMSLPQVKHDH